ncbi:MAG TPA: hypothetical protein VMW19_21335 [Myxococcota bacterium]|nr:hypothetical protein [Myxococcota bacterium]
MLAGWDIQAGNRLSESGRYVKLPAHVAGVGQELRALGFATRSGEDATLQAFASALLETFRRAAAGGPGFAWPTEEEIIERAGALLALAQHDLVVRIPAEFVQLVRVFLRLGGLFQHYRPQVD